MRRWGNYKGLIAIIGLAAIFTLMGMIIGSNLSIPDKLKAEQSPTLQKETESGSYGSNNDIMSTSGHSPFVHIAENATPAVVNISAESVTEDKAHNFMDDDFFRRFFGTPPPDQGGNNPQEPRMRRSESLGSGFIFSNDGFVMTNNHVVKGADKVTVTLSNQKSYKAEIVGSDDETDIAVLKIKDDGNFPTIQLGDSDSILVGDWVMAVGNPFPNLGLDRTVTVGVVSAKGRKGLSFGDENPSYQNYIQTDASINPGNSGGPLLNLKGQVIGVNSAIVTPSGGNIGIGFAIPINLAKGVADQLMHSGVVTRGYLGIFPQDITPELKDANGLPSADGVIVAQIDKDTPAANSSLKVGDVILTFDGKPINNAQQFRFLVADEGPGSTIRLGIWRNGENKNVEVKLGDRAKYVNQSQSNIPPGEKVEKWLGLNVETLTDSNAKTYNLEAGPGALITAIQPGSPSDEAGLRVGDVVLKVAGKDVTNAGDFNKIAKDMKDIKKPISFYIKRGNGNIFVAVSPEQ